MEWLGTMLHLIYPPTVDPVAQRLAALADERCGYVATIGAARTTLERIAGDPLDQTLHLIVGDLGR